MPNSDIKKIPVDKNHDRKSDSTGIAKNVIWSWIGHFVFIIAGFLLPRFMDRKLGPEMLGLWDFAWSFVGYLQLMQFDVGSSVNRYVAKYRAVNDTDGLNTAVTSVMLLQMAMAAVILIATGLIILLLPHIWGNKLGNLLAEASVLIFLLGSSTAFSFGFGSFSGVITGCHKWKMYNIISSGYHMGSTLVMIFTLFIFNSLTILALVYVFERILVSLTYLFASHAVCKDLKVRLRFFKLSMAISMLKFGGKGFSASMARTLLYQTNNILIIRFLGPVALALYSRPLNLINRLKSFSSKFANTLTPVSSQLQAEDNKTELQNMILKMGLAGACIGLPAVIYLVIMGGPLMQIWMGEDYNNSLLVAILAAGHLMPISNFPLYTILMGLNAHGRPALFNCISGVFSVLLTFLLLGYYKMGIIAVAFSISCSLFISDGIYLPLTACKKLKINYKLYYRKVWGKAIVYNLPFLVILLISRQFFTPFKSFAFGSFAAVIALIFVYWHKLLTLEQKNKIVSRIIP